MHGSIYLFTGVLFTKHTCKESKCKTKQIKLMLNLDSFQPQGVFLHGHMNQWVHEEKISFNRLLWLISVYIHIFIVEEYGKSDQ